MKTLLALLQSPSTETDRRIHVISSLAEILPYETDDIIRDVVEKWKKILAPGDSEPTLQLACMEAFCRAWRQLELVEARPAVFVSKSRARARDIAVGVWELLLPILKLLLPILVSGKNSQLREAAAQCLWAGLRLKVFSNDLKFFPGDLSDTLKVLFDAFFANEVHDGARHLYIGSILAEFSRVPENGTEICAVQGALEGLVAILANLDGASHPN